MTSTAAPTWIAPGVMDVVLAEAAPGEVALATCDLRVQVHGVDRAAGVERWDFSPGGSDCLAHRRVGMAGQPDGSLLVAWLGVDDRATASLVGSDHAQVARFDLGPAPGSVLGPQVAATATGWLVVAPNGTGLVVGLDGSELARFRHAAIAAHPDVHDLGLQFDGSRAVFAPVWGGAMAVGVHTYVYDVIELSSARVVP